MLGFSDEYMKGDVVNKKNVPWCKGLCVAPSCSCAKKNPYANPHPLGQTSGGYYNCFGLMDNQKTSTSIKK